MVSVREWGDGWRKKTKDSDHVQAHEALALLLDDDISALDAAKLISANYEPSIKALAAQLLRSQPPYSKVCYFWMVFMFDAIRKFGSVESQERLISLLIELSKQPDVLGDDGCPVEGYVRDGVYWSDLPGWERTFVEDGLYIRNAEEFYPSSHEKYLAQVPGYLNVTRFAARLLERELFAKVLPIEAACALQKGLEHNYDDDSYALVGVGRADWPAMIPAATIWLLVAGEQIYRHCVSGDVGDGWDRGRWSREMWAWWKERLGTFAERRDFGEDCKAFAAETLKKMSEIEQAHE